MTRGLGILGSTGSIGQNCLRVVKSLPGRFRVVTLAAGRNLETLAQQIVEFSPRHVVVADSQCIEPLRQRLQALQYRQPLEIGAGVSAQVEAVRLPEVDFVVSASHGTTGLVATYEAIRAGKQVGLANKETLVAAGELVTRAARERALELLPIDSEHCAIHQCLRSGLRQEVRRLILTGSGGPFLKTPRTRFGAITPEMALKHPVWKMGGRITIDSSTLMNKGLEIIEARWLFGFASAQIEVMIHPESIIHSMIEFCDGSIVAQLSVPDMRLPLQYALTYPDRVPVNGDGLSLDLIRAGRLNFKEPDTRRFPCLELAREALNQGGLLPCALNAADEIAVESFLARRLDFESIPRVIEKVLSQAAVGPLNSMDDVLEGDREARRRATEVIEAISN